MDTFKITIREAPIFLLHEKLEVEANFIIFYEVEMIKL
jgi:hypothetical protein